MLALKDHPFPAKKLAPKSTKPNDGNCKAPGLPGWVNAESVIE